MDYSQMFDLKDFKWEKNRNQISMPWQKGFPPTVAVHSSRTNKVITYKSVDPSDWRFDQDQWDGVQMVYKTLEKTNNAEYLVLYHGEV